MCLKGINLTSLFLLLLSLDGVTIFPIPGNYAPVSLGRAAFNDDGEIFCLIDESRVAHLNGNGDVLKIFSRSGEGPGELLSTLFIGWHEGTVWVYDGRISIFDEDGRFLKQLKSEVLTPFFRRHSGGWVTFKHNYGDSVPARVVHYSEDLESELTLYEFEPQWLHPEKTFRPWQEMSSVPHNPAREFTAYAVSPKGRFAYLIPPGPQLRIVVFNLETKKVQRIIKREEEPYPFNKDWGRQKVKELRQAGNGNVVLDAPENNPIVRGAFVTPDGYLVIEKWTTEPDLVRRFLVLDSEGNEKTLPYDTAYAWRVLHYQGDMVFLTGYDNEKDQPTFLKCSAADIQSVCKNNPVQFEEVKKAWVSIK